MFCPPKGAKQRYQSWWAMTCTFTTNNTQHYLELLSKTSQDNGYAHRSLKQQVKMMVTGYLKQSFIQNISQQRNSKLREITITISEKGKNPMSPALSMCKSWQTSFKILFSRNSFKNCEPPEQRSNKFTLWSTSFGWNKLEKTGANIMYSTQGSHLAQWYC